MPHILNCSPSLHEAWDSLFGPQGVGFLKSKNIYQHLNANIFDFSDSLGKSGDLEIDQSMSGAEEQLPFLVSHCRLCFFPQPAFLLLTSCLFSCKHLSLYPLHLPKFSPLIFTFLFMAHLFLQFKLKYYFSHIYSPHHFPLVPSPSVTVSACP